jgi:hypothetical protein
VASETPSATVNDFLRPFQDALACVAHGKVTVSPGGRRPGSGHAWTLNDGKSVALAGGRGIWLRATMNYKVVRTEVRHWRVHTEAYLYAVGSEAGELLSWHWHPRGNSPAQEPHMHPGFAVLLPEGVISPGAHLPTARMSFEDVISTLITEVGVEPMHDDWQSRLAHGRDIFELNRTWAVRPGDGGG